MPLRGTASVPLSGTQYNCTAVPLRGTATSCAAMRHPAPAQCRYAALPNTGFVSGLPVFKKATDVVGLFNFSHFFCGRKCVHLCSFLQKVRFLKSACCRNCTFKCRRARCVGRHYVLSPCTGMDGLHDRWPSASSKNLRWFCFFKFFKNLSRRRLD